MRKKKSLFIIISSGKKKFRAKTISPLREKSTSPPKIIRVFFIRVFLIFSTFPSLSEFFLQAHSSITGRSRIKKQGWGGSKWFNKSRIRGLVYSAGGRARFWKQPSPLPVIEVQLQPPRHFWAATLSWKLPFRRSSRISLSARLARSSANQLRCMFIASS